MARDHSEASRDKPARFTGHRTGMVEFYKQLLHYTTLLLVRRYSVQYKHTLY